MKDLGKLLELHKAVGDWLESESELNKSLDNIDDLTTIELTMTRYRKAVQCQKRIEELYNQIESDSLLN